MDQLQPKTGNPLPFFPCNSNHVLLNFHFHVVLVHIFFSKTKTFQIASKVEADSTGVPVGLNNNVQEPGETNKNVVHNDQHATAPAQIYFTHGSLNDHST